MARAGTKFKEVLTDVRINLAYVVVFMVAISVLALGLLLLDANNRIATVSEDNIDQVVTEEYPALQLFVQETDSEELVRIINLVRSDFQLQTERTLQFYTPLVVLAAGFIAFMIARQLVKPIQQTYKSQERFIQDAAHELRNPLAAMKVTIQSMQAKRKLTGVDAQKMIDSMDRQVSRLIEINENLLFLDRADDHKAIRVNVSELLRDVAEDVQELALNKELELKQKIQPDIEFPIQSEDFVRMSRNLLENAIKYSQQESGEIRIGLRKKGSRLRLSIRDFGIGIPESEQHKIGSRFYRASNTTAHEGTGLGLAIVQKIARVYGGTVTINSKYGEGTHVVVTL